MGENRDGAAEFACVCLLYDVTSFSVNETEAEGRLGPDLLFEEKKGIKSRSRL